MLPSAVGVQPAWVLGALGSKMRLCTMTMAADAACEKSEDATFRKRVRKGEGDAGMSGGKEKASVLCPHMQPGQ